MSIHFRRETVRTVGRVLHGDYFLALLLFRVQSPSLSLSLSLSLSRACVHAFSFFCHLSMLSFFLSFFPPSKNSLICFLISSYRVFHDALHFGGLGFDRCGTRSCLPNSSPESIPSFAHHRYIWPARLYCACTHLHACWTDKCKVWVAFNEHCVFVYFAMLFSVPCSLFSSEESTIACACQATKQAKHMLSNRSFTVEGRDDTAVLFLSLHFWNPTILLLNNMINNII